MTHHILVKALKNLFFIIAFCSVLLCCGCEKATNSFTENIVAADTGLSISGTVALPADTAGLIAQTGAAITASGTEVYLEDFSRIRTLAGDDGSFVLENVPPGAHTIIANFKTPAATYKQRSNQVSITDKPVNIGRVNLAIARNFISGFLRDASHNPVVNATLLMWGEIFHTDHNGFFTSPLLPSGVSSAQVFITQATGFTTFNFTAEFNDDIVPLIEISLTDLGSKLMPPLIQIIPEKTRLARGEQITLTARTLTSDQSEPTNTPILWHTSAGRIIATGDGATASWIAPDDNITATVTASITDKTGLSARASIAMVVGAGGIGNQRPSASDIRIASAAASLKITYNLSDPENDLIDNTVTFSTDNGETFQQTTNVSGDLSAVSPGSGRSIIWHTGLDITSLSGQIIVRIIPADQFGAGNAAQSPLFSLTPENIKPVAGPMNLAISSSDASNTLAWSPVSGAVSYKLYWDTSTSVNPKTSASFAIATGPFTHADLTNGSTYYYVVTALNKWGESPPSTIVSGRPLPVLPQIQTLTPAPGSYGNPGNTTLSITCNAQIMAGEGRISLYKDNGILHQSISAGNATFTGNSLSITLEQPLDDDTFYYVIIDHNAIKDVYNRELSGLSNSSDWRFKTAFTYNENLQYNLVTINASAAWVYSTGEGITVAVIDTGIEPAHPELVGQLTEGGKDFFNDGYFLQDGLGHGTHVAGIIAARGNDSGVIGIAPRARLYISKVFSRTGTGPSAAMIVSAVEDAVNNGARIINMSIGTKTFNSSYEDIAAWARTQGAVIFAASGNDTSDQLRYLAACPSAIAVGATDSNDNHWSMANYGPALAFSAPGEQILSTLPGASYGLQSGTSMASPQVAAVAALVLARNPDFSVEQLMEALIWGSTDLGAAGRDPYFGYGRIDALKAVEYTPGASGSLRASSLQKLPEVPAKSDFNAANFVPGQLLLRLKAGNSPDNVLIKAGLNKVGSKILKILPMPDSFLISVPAGREIELGKQLQSLTEVIYAELNAIISLD